MRRLGLAVAAIVLLAIGAAGGVYWSRRHPVERAAPAAPPAASPPSASAPSPSAEPAEVTLTPEAVKRAGITTTPARVQRIATSITVPGTVTSNAYRDTKVSALVGGIVRQVRPELGQTVRRGEPLAVVFSHDLADGQMKYLSMRAMLDADHQKRERTRKLLAIGAASRQELEDVEAMHRTHEAELAAARQRLLLLGLSAPQVDALRDGDQVVSEVTVPSPADGVILARAVNPGQVVTAGQELFVVTDVRTVWVIGDVYEKDAGAARIGAPVSVLAPTRPSKPIPGRIAYVDPRVDPAARTTKMRVEVANPDGELRFGMFVQVSLGTSDGEARTMVPRSAVQSVGGRSVVYLATDDEGRFVERPVTLGAASGDGVQVLDGVKPGERVVTDGSFFLRAEAARLR